MNIEAYAGDDAVIQTGDMLIKAANDTLLVSVTGGVGIGVGAGLAVGADLSLIYTEDTVHAWIGGAADVTADDVRVFALNDEEVVSVAAALAAAMSGDDSGDSGGTGEVPGGSGSGEDSDGSAVGAAGSVAWVDLGHDVQAYIGGKEAGTDGAIDLTGSLYLDADDQSTLYVIAGSAGGGKTAGVGLAGAKVNVDDRTVKAFIGENAEVTTGGTGSGILDRAAPRPVVSASLLTQASPIISLYWRQAVQ